MSLRHDCLHILERWFKGREHAVDLLEEASQNLGWSSRDRALAQGILYGILRNLRRFDYWIQEWRGNGQLDPELRSVLLIGMSQLFALGLAEHAAVNETVELATSGRGLVNALLRRALREKHQMELAENNWPPARRYSHPDWMFKRWESRYGADNAAALCAWNQLPAPIFIRANRLIPGAVAEIEKTAKAMPDDGSFYQCETMPLPWLSQGIAYIQDPSTWAACALLDPQLGEMVLDLCACPGGKTAILAQMMGNQGQIWACDSRSDRMARLRNNLKRLGVTNTTAAVFDSTRPGMAPPWGPQLADRILLDVPCSNTGVIRRRVDVRWRLTPIDFIEQAKLQFALIRSALRFLKPGGVLVYSTCSLEAEENRDMVQKALDGIPGLTLDDRVERLPFRDQRDGAYAARFKKR